MAASKPVKKNDCSGEETDSSDETFSFTSKRKASAFFLDVSDSEEFPQKKKICLSVETAPCDTTDCVAEVACVSIEPVVHVDSDVPKGKCDSGASAFVPEIIDLTKEIVSVKQEPVQFAQLSNAKECDVIDITNSPKQVFTDQECADGLSDQHVDVTDSGKSQPEGQHIVQILEDSTDGDDDKLPDLIDLVPDVAQHDPVSTTSNINNRPGSPDDSSSNVQPLPQNQLMDREASAMYDAVWYGKQYHCIGHPQGWGLHPPCQTSDMLNHFCIQVIH